MFNASRLLSQVMNSSQGQDLARMAQQAMGGSSGTAQPTGGDAGGGSGRADLMKGALAGGLVGLLIGNKRTRKMVGKGAGTALKLGGIAAVGALAYTAWQRHKGNQTENQPQIAPPPQGSAFAPESSPAGADGLARGVLVAMIQGAKADGHIDADEQSRIFGHVETLDLSSEEKAFLMDELAAPQDLSRVVAYAEGPEVAAELYAASLLAMDPDTPEERAWLDQLARDLRIEHGLKRELELTVASGI